jgi:D,D-heptose 1,7-bisphosphate phosphatase
MGISDSTHPVFQQFNTSIQNKTLIVDRDNTLIADQVHQVDINKLFFLPEALENLRKMSKMSVNIVIATNQGGVALGKFSEKNLRAFHKEINRILITNDILLFGVIYCLHHENAIEDKDKNCECRKPKPGMLKKVIDLTNSSQDRTAMIGDSWRDKDAAAAIKIQYFDANSPTGWVSATEWAEKQ